jgi:hypothetical protein
MSLNLKTCCSSTTVVGAAVNGQDANAWQEWNDQRRMAVNTELETTLRYAESHERREGMCRYYALAIDERKGTRSRELCTPKFQPIVDRAVSEYKKKTRKDLITDPLAEEIKAVILLMLSSPYFEGKPTNSINLRAAMSDSQSGLRQP